VIEFLDEVPTGWSSTSFSAIGSVSSMNSTSELKSARKLTKLVKRTGSIGAIRRYKEARNNMNQLIEYRKPVIVDLSSVMEIIQGTLIKGQRGIIEAIHWRILPAYEVDD